MRSVFHRSMQIMPVDADDEVKVYRRIESTQKPMNNITSDVPTESCHKLLRYTPN